MAERLGTPVRQLKKSYRPVDFRLHQEYILREEKAAHDREWKERHREDYYLAQIAHLLYRVDHRIATIFEENPPKPKLKLDDFFIRPKADADRGEGKPSETDYLNKVVVKSAMDSAAVAMCLGVRVSKGG